MWGNACNSGTSEPPPRRCPLSGSFARLTPAADRQAAANENGVCSEMATLAQKLGLRPPQRICLLDATPASALLIREAAPAGCNFAPGLDDAPYDLIFCWPVELAGLAEQFAILQRRIVSNGAIWAVLPKKSVAGRRGVLLTWEQMQAAALTTDLVDNKIASLSEEEYATRFVLRHERRPATAKV